MHIDVLPSQDIPFLCCRFPAAFFFVWLYYTQSTLNKTEFKKIFSGSKKLPQMTAVFSHSI